MTKAIKTLLVALLLTPLASQAHEIRPGYLEISQISAEAFDISWRVPARGTTRLRLDVILPINCLEKTPATRVRAGGAFLDRWSVNCGGGLTGQTLSIDGLSMTLTDVLVRIDRLDGTSQTARLTPDQVSMVVTASPTWQQVAMSYLGLGVDHILAGIDHLLFVFALLLLVRDWRRLVLTVTAFTVAHSLTLGAAAMGFVKAPQAPIEAVIALSIVFVAVELLERDKNRLAFRSPWVVAFAFGLLHGFGFAGALTEIGLPQTSIPIALLFFNVGVEIGQLLFIAGCLVIGFVTRRLHLHWPASLAKIPAYAIGSLAAFWTIERIASF